MIIVLVNRGSSVVSWNSSREEHLPNSLCFYDWEYNSRCTLLYITKRENNLLEKRNEKKSEMNVRDEK